MKQCAWCLREPDPSSCGMTYCPHREEPKRQRTPRIKKPKPPKLAPLPDEIWVMYLSMNNSAGSIAHVSHGDKFYRTEDECQKAIDEMPSWLGMGDRKRYRPMCLVSNEKKED